MALSDALKLQFQAARIGMCLHRPYLSQALFALQEQSAAGPMPGPIGVDQWWRIYIDEEAVQHWTIKHWHTVLEHEIWHLLREHPARRAMMAANPMLWNLAGDAEINDDLLSAGGNFPFPPITPESLECKPNDLAENYYHEVQQHKHACQQCGQDTRKEQKNGKSQSGEAPGTGSGQGKQRSASGKSGQQGSGKGQQAADGQGQGQGDGTGDGHGEHTCPGCGKSVGQSCGSSATGVREPWELPGPAEGGPEGIGSADGALIRQAVARAILEDSQSRGTIPAGFQRWAEKYGRVRVDPKEWFNAALRQAAATYVAGMADYTMQRPSRRQSAMPHVVMPGWRMPVPNVAVVVDTSGSMSDQRVGMCLAWIDGATRAMGCKQQLQILSVDAAAHNVQRVWRANQVQLYGGGGTDMMEGIHKAAALRPRPDIIIVLTDGECPWDENPGVKAQVVIGLLGEPSYSKPPKWAKVIALEGEVMDAHEKSWKQQKKSA